VIWVFRLFGFEIARIERVELAYEEEDDSPSFAGGSGHNFERDLNPVSPDDRYAPWDDFGFQARRSE